MHISANHDQSVQPESVSTEEPAPEEIHGTGLSEGQRPADVGGWSR